METLVRWYIGVCVCVVVMANTDKWLNRDTKRGPKHEMAQLGITVMSTWCKVDCKVDHEPNAQNGEQVRVATSGKYPRNQSIRQQPTLPKSNNQAKTVEHTQLRMERSSRTHRRSLYNILLCHKQSPQESVFSIQMQRHCVWRQLLVLATKVDSLFFLNSARREMIIWDKDTDISRMRE